MLFFRLDIKKAPLKGAFAVRTGLEPATPCVTGTYSNQLNYRTNILNELISLFLDSKQFFILTMG